MSLSRDMSGHVGTLSGHFAYVGKYHEDKCLVLETCRDMSQDIYILMVGYVGRGIRKNIVEFRNPMAISVEFKPFVME